ncbi:preprotein translocase subunit SecG [Candidatus Parcubacteria bacterium]|nr:MAG: preprotein translocase subunit SecG [Candidatus Parcubacteria bacterium]
MSIITIIQLVVAISLMIVILMQNRGGAMSGIFGGGGSNVYMTKRGLEKKLFTLTIILAVLFFVVSLLNFFVTA